MGTTVQDSLLVHSQCTQTSKEYNIEYNRGISIQTMTSSYTHTHSIEEVFNVSGLRSLPQHPGEPQCRT